MTNQKSFLLLDLIIQALKWKKQLATTFIISLFVSYGFIRLLMTPLYDSKALIIPSEQEPLAGIFSLVSNFSSAIPGGLSSLKLDSEMGLYTTIIYSRTFLEDILDKFELRKKYIKTKRRSSAVKAVSEMISINITLDNAYQISVRSPSAELSAQICTYILEKLNEKIINLNISKSKDNRVFLENRYNEIFKNLKIAEDSLLNFQQQTGFIEAETQSKKSLETYAKLEAEIAVKEVETNILQNTYGKNSPKTIKAKKSYYAYKQKLASLISSKDSNSVLVGLKDIPKKAAQYYKYYRDVKVYNEMLNYLIPLLEQAKFDEQKTIPIMQIIDYPIAPDKKSYPPRTLLAGIFALIITSTLTVFLLIYKFLLDTTNKQFIELRKQLFIKVKKD